MALELEAEPAPTPRLGEVGYHIKPLPPCDRPLCGSGGACPCCIAALVDESANYGGLQETLANTDLPCFRGIQP